MIKDTVEKIAELAHTDKTDFTSADMIDMDEVESLIKNAIVSLHTEGYFFRNKCIDFIKRFE